MAKVVGLEASGRCVKSQFMVVKDVFNYGCEAGGESLVLLFHSIPCRKPLLLGLSVVAATHQEEK